MVMTKPKKLKPVDVVDDIIEKTNKLIDALEKKYEVVIRFNIEGIRFK